ncbi:MAG: flagellar protein FliT [Gammaproteobacteria bacterium]|nr:flagellar protein FliT [Gammaproteobacteria bacterium]
MPVSETTTTVLAILPDDCTRLHGLTRDLLARARAGDWEAVAVVEHERRPVLQAVCTALAPHGAGTYEALLTEILAADREVIQLAQQHRDELGGQLREMGHGRNAVRAYGQHRR